MSSPDSLEADHGTRAHPGPDCYSQIRHLHVSGCGTNGDVFLSNQILRSLVGGVDPAKALAVTLDVGTNNKDLLEDRLYVVRIARTEDVLVC